MSQEIGAVLKEIIKEKKISNFQLAKEVGVDRTTLQHYLSGKRKLQLVDLQKIMAFLNLNKDKKRLLYTLYENEYDDREVLKNSYDIFCLYQDLSNHINLAQECIDTEEYLVKNELAKNKIRIIKGQVKIEGIIRSCFIEEMGRNQEAHVIMSINFKHFFLYELITRITNGQNNCGKIQNIIPLVNKKKLGNNLDILSTVLLLKGLDNVEYEPYYFYSGTKIYDDISIIVPNYFITSKQVITIDRDFESAIIYEDPEILDYYRKKSQSILNKCACFVEKKQDIQMKTKNASFEKVNKDGKITKFIAFDRIDTLGENEIKNLKSITKKTIPAISEEDSPKNMEIFVLRDGLIRNPNNLCIRYLVNEKTIEFLIIDETSNKVKQLLIDEIGLVILFKEIFNYLPNSVHVYSQNEINNVLRNMRSLPIS